MKQVDTKKLVLGCLLIMLLMILYTKVDMGMKSKETAVETEAVIGDADQPTSLLLSDRVAGFADLSEVAMKEAVQNDASSDSTAQDEETILGPAEPMDLEKAKKESYGLVAELDYVSADRISLHGTFGYMAIALSEQEDGAIVATIERAVTFEELGGINMGGAAYTDMIGGDGCVLIIPGIRNEEIARRRQFLYIEETNEITGGIVAPDWMMKKASNHDYSDVVIEESLEGELRELLKSDALLGTDEAQKYKLLHGPAAVPEYSSNMYGFLAEDGDNLENLWYGLWNRDLGSIVKIPLFPTES